MANPFSGIITPAFKATFNNMIDALLETTALTVPCRLSFGVTKNTACANCILDTITKISSNRYKPGGPVPFSNSVCPMCGGAGFIPVETTESFNMAVIWQRSKFIDVGIKVPTLGVQTVSHITRFPSLSKCKDIFFDTNIEAIAGFTYQRVGAPMPIGFGDSRYCITIWERVG